MKNRKGLQVLRRDGALACTHKQLQIKGNGKEWSKSQRELMQIYHDAGMCTWAWRVWPYADVLVVLQHVIIMASKCLMSAMH